MQFIKSYYNSYDSYSRFFIYNGARISDCPYIYYES